MNTPPLIFITGAPRSGTSIFKKVFREHPELSACGIEACYLLEVLDQFGDTIHCQMDALKAVEQNRFGLGAKTTARYIERYQATLQESISFSEFFLRVFAVASRPSFDQPVLLQYPGRGLLEAARLRERFPTSRFIILMRDPRANVCSQLHSFQNRSMFRSLRLWKGCYQTAQELHTALPEDVLIVSYEQLLSSAERTCRWICDFLHINYWPGLVDFNVRCPEFDAPHEGQVKTFTRFETRMIDKWKESLSPAQIRFIDLVCRREITEAGYPASGAKPGIHRLTSLVASDLLLHLKNKMTLHRLNRSPAAR